MNVPQFLTRLKIDGLDFTIRAANAVIRALHRQAPHAPDPDIAAIRARAAIPTDISSHLEPIFLEASRTNPRLIVELGVREGESTFVLERVARRCGGTLVSVDVADCSSVCHFENWHFVQEDDVAFGHRFADWSREHGVAEQIDVLFIDTSHLYDHTIAEIQAWLPHLSAAGVVIFHDTNLKRLYRRRDGTLGLAWDNSRGVMQALEAILHAQFDERRGFERRLGPWLLRHDPLCNGLTVLRREPQRT